MWKRCVENDRYEVSDTGKVRRFGRRNILKQRDKAGYMAVRLHGKQYFVHRLVGHAFIGPSDLGINHKDGVKSNNRIENLEFVTVQENNRHAIETGLNYIAPISSIDINGVIIDYKYINDAVEKTGISRKMIEKNLYGERRSTHGLRFFHTGKEAPEPPELIGEPAKKAVVFTNKNGIMEYYESIGEASRATGKGKRSISRWCNGETKCLSGGWRFATQGT